jgi:hypothetical protein
MLLAEEPDGNRSTRGALLPLVLKAAVRRLSASLSDGLGVSGC